MFEAPGRSPLLHPEGWLRWAFPLDEEIGTATQVNECSYKADSGELISGRGGLRVQGTTEYWNGVTFHGRKADVDKTLISARKVHSKGHVAVVSNGGYIILHNSALARTNQQSFNLRLSMNLVQYVFFFFGE